MENMGNFNAIHKIQLWNNVKLLITFSLIYTRLKRVFHIMEMSNMAEA